VHRGIGGDSTGTIVTVAGSPQATLPYSAYFDSGSSVSYAYSDPVGSTVAGKRYALTTPAATPASPITVSAAATITATYKVQYQLTLAITGVVPGGPGNLTGGAGGRRAEGAAVGGLA